MSDYTANVGRMPWRLTEDVETAIGPKLADPFVDHLDGVTSVDFAARAAAALIQTPGVNATQFTAT